VDKHFLQNDIENYPAFEHVGGFELMNKFEQAKSFGAEFVYEEVSSIQEDKIRQLTIKTTTDNQYDTRTIILAFGKTPRDLNVPGEKELNGKGVSYCAVCDGPLFKNKTVSVVGTGELALEAAIYLKQLASKVNIIFRGDKPIGSEETIDLLQQQQFNSKITFIANSVVKSINGGSKVESLTLFNSKTNSVSKIAVDGVFVEMGYIAKTDIVKDLVQLKTIKKEL
jgi:thioredoxin reductase (NADPH)